MNTRATPQTEVILRLRSAAGHLNAVIEMAEDGRCCEDVLHQLRAVEAALHHAGGRLLCSQIEQSEALILQNASAARRATELKRLISWYSILMHGSNRRPEETK